MMVNQAGEPVKEELLYTSWGDAPESVTNDERDKAIALLCEHLGVCVYRTNATKHGTTELVLRKD